MKVPDEIIRETPSEAYDPYPWDYGLDYSDPDDYPSEDELSRYCHYCGKEYEDWSDRGCEYCDIRHPGYGTMA